MTKPSRPTLADIRKAWPATVPVTQAANALGCSRSHLHNLINRGEAPVKTLPLGRRHVVVTADLIRLLSGEPPATAQEQGAA
ncbi:helix-turn-helix domain-containing protein [Streptomyces sp. SID8379]|uniref:helix-turn-helix transcriptional regulator n=1 Tax=unclassified Streptomyces TaxID=2593676 RepID=UPI000364EB6F|nr:MULTISPECIES: helix-turn-helix domain-containing protein [unclassified Streptomyces]MYW66276.1 helix-turn-helix domain-containing protein [Streptomyces sp. SID8379]